VIPHTLSSRTLLRLSRTRTIPGRNGLSNPTSLREKTFLTIKRRLMLSITSVTSLDCASLDQLERTEPYLLQTNLSKKSLDLATQFPSLIRSLTSGRSLFLEDLCSSSFPQVLIPQVLSMISPKRRRLAPCLNILPRRSPWEKSRKFQLRKRLRMDL